MYVTAFSSSQLCNSTKTLLNNACSMTGRHNKSTSIYSLKHDCHVATLGIASGNKNMQSMEAPARYCHMRYLRA